MALVTGFLSDFGLGDLSDHHPMFVFEPSGPAVGDVKVYAPRQIAVVTSTDGYFEADLQPNDVVHPATFYRVAIRWGGGRSIKLPWKLSVPSEGGPLADLLRVPSNPAAVWIGITEPENPSPGTWWLNPETGELQEWSP